MEFVDKVVVIAITVCETLPSKASPYTLTRLGVELVRIRQNKENRRWARNGTERGESWKERAMRVVRSSGGVSYYLAWTSSPLQSMLTGKNADEVK